MGIPLVPITNRDTHGKDDWFDKEWKLRAIPQTQQVPGDSSASFLVGATAGERRASVLSVILLKKKMVSISLSGG